MSDNYDSARGQGMNRYDDNRAVDVDDINFENKEEEDYDEGANSYRNRSRRGYGENNAPTGGTAGRIASYRQASGSDKYGKNQKDLPSEEDYTASGREVRMEMDVKEVLVNLNEVQNLQEVVNLFEKNYFGAKKKMNGLDQQGLQSDSQSQALKLNYLIIKSALYNENPNFDNEKMEYNLDQVFQKVQQVNQSYSQFKGDFFACSEPVINQDLLQMKLDKVSKYQIKQDSLLQKLPDHENGMRDCAGKVQQIKQRYESFEKQQFEKKFSDTRLIIKDTTQLIQKIESQQQQLQETAAAAKDDLEQVIPSNQDQRARLQKILTDIYSIEKRIEGSVKVIEQECVEFDRLTVKHQENNDALQKLQYTELIQSIAQSRQIAAFVENHDLWVQLYKRLKQLADDDISAAEQDLQRVLQDSKKYLDNVRGERKDEYDDLFRQIQKLAKKVGEESNELHQRLNDFEGEITQLDGPSEHVPDADMIFLKKEIARNRSAITAVVSNKDQILASSQKLSQGQDINQEDILQLNQNLKGLEKLDGIDVPRIRRNIDTLEAFSLKALKNQLNEDNKKSQNMISKMKKNYEDLQRLIDTLNQKIDRIEGQAKVVQDQFTNEDLERINEIQALVIDKLNECDKDVNGDRAERQGGSSRGLESENPNKPKSLQARKKLIIANINKMVNQFNENNKLIKESNKVPKSEKEMAELIKRNKEIQDDCKQIDDMINQGKTFAQDINDRLDHILDPTIPSIKDKYTDKNQAIDECDELFDKAQSLIDRLDGTCEEQLEKLEGIIAKLDVVNPVNNPSSSGEDNSKFLNDVSAKLDQANQLRDDVEKNRARLQATRDKLIAVVQPLNELAEREVKEPEIGRILKALDDINADLQLQDREINPKTNEIDQLDIDVDNMLKRNKRRKIDDAASKLAQLDALCNSLQGDTAAAFRKLEELKDLLEDAKAKQGREDPELMNKLRAVEAEAQRLERELKDADEQLNDLRRKRGESKKLLDDIRANPDKFTPQQVDTLLYSLDEQLDKGQDLNGKIKSIEEQLDQKIQELKDLINQSDARKTHQGKVNDLLNQINEDMRNFRGLLDGVPSQIEAMLRTLQEMKNGSEPDESADYWEERRKIDKNMSSLTACRDKFERFEKDYQKKRADIDAATAPGRRPTDLQGLQQQATELQAIQQDLFNKLSEAFDVRDEVDQIKKDMGQCEIPVNIACRRSELEGLSERLDRINEDFADLRQADEDFDGDSASEQEIKRTIQKIENTLRNFEQERKDMFKYQTNPLEKYGPKDFVNFTVAPKIIIQVREFKAKIEDTNRRLKDLEQLMETLNAKLIEQDMENATRLLRKKSHSLRERLTEAKADLTKISNTGNEMEGNTTHNEEDEFIDALKDEMPQVFKNIEANFGLIDKVDRLMDEVMATKNVEKMGELKKNVDEASAAVEQSEGLVQKLEGELIEWNARNKLVRRDEELAEIDDLLQDFKADLQMEHNDMQGEIPKNEQKMAQAATDIDQQNLAQQREGIQNYLAEIEELSGEVEALQNKRDTCFNEFDADIPSIIKEERAHRIQYQNSQLPKGAPRRPVGFSTASDKPDDIYYMIHINCKYRKRIHTMLKDLRLINQKRRELEEKYAPLKRQLSTVTVVKKYKAVKGDQIDEMFAEALNRANLNLPVKRLAQGKYMFGSRQIMAKIINGKLVIRVGGGYMSVDEFIDQYGKIELLKLMKAEGDPMADEILKKGGGARHSTVGEKRLNLEAERENLKNILSENTRTYVRGETNDIQRSSFGARAAQKTRVSNVAESHVSMETYFKSGAAKSPSPQRPSKLGGYSPNANRGRGSGMARDSSADHIGYSPKGGR